MKVSSILLAGLYVGLVGIGALLNSHHFDKAQAGSEHVDFNRDIRPIFNKNCTSCHGGVKQAGGISFVYRESLLGKGKSGRPTIVPGRPSASELIARVTSRDPAFRMPLHGAALPADQIEILKKWISEGARWQDYWAFVPPVPQQIPIVKTRNWVRQPEDNFVLAKLEGLGLGPSREADRAALLRRVSLDLTGLPPTPQELASFLADKSSNSYEKEVDRLLASPHFGERWASMWLDLARYADSKGYEQDRLRRGAWPYRDWVINAYNKNVPYNKFVITQLAGDLLPNPTIDDRIATAFHRQTPANDEGGTDDEEYRLVAVMDRTATTWSVLNGVTFNCVQCHSHPYDPIKHVEYYKFLAYFNTSRDTDLRDDYPRLVIPKDRAKTEAVGSLQNKIKSLETVIVRRGRQAEQQLKDWTALQLNSGTIDRSAGYERLASYLSAGEIVSDRLANNLEGRSPDEIKKYLKTSVASTKKQLDGLKASAPAGGTADSTLRVVGGDAYAPSELPNVSVYKLLGQINLPKVTALRIEVLPHEPNVAVHTPEDGFYINGIDAWLTGPGQPDQKIVFRYLVSDSEQNLETGLRRLSFVDTSRSDGGGAATDPILRLAEATQFVANPKLFRTRWVIAIPDIPLKLAPGTRIRIELAQVSEIDDKPAAARHIRLAASGNAAWTTLAHDTTLSKQLVELEKAQSELKNVPSVFLPIMEEQPPYERRPTKEFERGSFLTKIGPNLTPGVPAIFPKMPASFGNDRLAMAKWFFLPSQPLTARVAVNRYWEQLFGSGIVETLEDFGSVGESPSNQALLDWMALHFQNDLHWNTKALLRELVTSATYRQSAVATSETKRRDPRNRLLARGPAQRLSAEMIRDQALAASGLLNPAIGGPSVMPSQPKGLWKQVGLYQTDWIDAVGPDRYRRALYTFLKRSAIYPSLATFDASEHVLSLPRRIPTNTPLQALVTLNDPAFSEAASALAKRMIKEGNLPGSGRLLPTGSEHGDVTEKRIQYGAILTLSRPLSKSELAALRRLYQIALTDKRGNTLSKASSQKVALTSVASALLNLDAALTR